MIRRSVTLLTVLLIVACDSGADRVATVGETASSPGGAGEPSAAGGPSTPQVTGSSAGAAELPVSPDDMASGTPAPDAASDPARSGPSTVTPPAGEAANDILERAERAYGQVRSMEADFSQEIYVPLLDATRASQGKMFHQAPDRFAMRFSDPEGDLIVADGSYLWMYHPSTDDRQVMRSRLAAGGQQVDLQREFLSDASSRYDAVKTGMESVGGRSAHALTLVPRGPSPYRRIRLWVDAQDFLVRRFEITEENESVRRLDLSNLRPNVPLAASIFQFTPPANAQIFEP